MATRVEPITVERVTFDFRGYGESEGQPHGLEFAAAKAEDIGAAVRFLQGNANVDAKRMGVLAICASAGYTVLAMKNEKNEPGIKSIEHLRNTL
ncbi:MAG: putative lysophospholipase [Hydrocarboniphaga sp.]|uniref:hypothetical protein n=1 Tax=Hydrocarboniphaga sp. TaxID=2033016 RepID=UPI0026137E4A|nr:hypothetical protein [Hydrocarboniphaga sp.]MDB5968746.1 putative lysophospholipase [Hydrocarboniphaga sp.]